jgi:hypothetical protein
MSQLATRYDAGIDEHSNVPFLRKCVPIRLPRKRGRKVYVALSASMSIVTRHGQPIINHIGGCGSIRLAPVR